MPTRKIKDYEGPEMCRDREHDPPSMEVFPPGVYEHECPSCKKKHRFTVYPNDDCIVPREWP